MRLIKSLAIAIAATLVGIGVANAGAILEFSRKAAPTVTEKPAANAVQIDNECEARLTGEIGGSALINQQLLHKRIYRLGLWAGLEKDPARALELKLRNVEDIRSLFDFVNLAEENINIASSTQQHSDSALISAYIKNDFRTLANIPSGTNFKMTSEQKKILQSELAAVKKSQLILAMYMRDYRASSDSENINLSLLLSRQFVAADTNRALAPAEAAAEKISFIESDAESVAGRLGVRSQLERLVAFFKSPAAKFLQRRNPTVYYSAVDTAYRLIFLWSEIAPFMELAQVHHGIPDEAVFKSDKALKIFVDEVLAIRSLGDISRICDILIDGNFKWFMDYKKFLKTDPDTVPPWVLATALKFEIAVGRAI